jgi:hypothetical protein
MKGFICSSSSKVRLFFKAGMFTEKSFLLSGHGRIFTANTMLILNAVLLPEPANRLAWFTKTKKNQPKFAYRKFLI